MSIGKVGRMDNLLSQRLGTVSLDPPGPVVAGSVGQWTLTYTVGSYGLDEGATIKLVQRLVSDWERPQFTDPTAPGYTTVFTNGAAKLRVTYQAKAYQRPWTPGIVIDVYDGYLSPGDTVTIVLGDQSQGSPGVRAQTFRESVHEFRVLVDPTNAHVVQRLPTSPQFPIVAAEIAELVCILPSQAVVGQPVEIFVKGQDSWGNPTPAPQALDLTWVGDGAAAISEGALTLNQPGSGYLLVTAQGAGRNLKARSNPLRVEESGPTLNRYWGDLHAQTSATVGTGTEEEYFTFGRDIARLDFTSHQGNDFQMTDQDWQRLNDTVRAFHQDGRFVVFPGYEWSANTPAGGDRNLFFRREGYPILRSSHWQIPSTPEDDQTPAHPADRLFARLRERVPLEDVLLGAHVGGRFADIRSYFDQELGPLVEVVSCWGIFEWLLWDALDQGYVVGIMGNSDGHKGRPGAEGPGAGEFGIANGLTCVLAENLTRDAVFQALKARRCYATTGPRMDLTFTGDGQPMGSLLETDQPVTLRTQVTGTAPIESLTLYAGRDVIQQVQPAAFAQCDDSPRIRLLWQGSRIRGRGRRVTWDGTVRVEGAKIAAATTVAFDAATDGILIQDEQTLSFSSSTTGDADGLDLVLSQAHSGTLIFDSPVLHFKVDLASLRGESRRKIIDCGGVDMQLCIERYPETLQELSSEFSLQVSPPPGQTTSYFVKVVQEDGHMAWASPIYIKTK